jgi:deoxyadenosine/deoxycytidine kinase
MGLLSTRDFENYKSLFELMISLVKPPDLLIYLKASIPTLVYQINKRGREYESGIRVDYLEGLNSRYEEWFANYKDGKKLIINVDELKFEDNPQDMKKVIELIEKEIR